VALVREERITQELGLSVLSVTNSSMTSIIHQPKSASIEKERSLRVQNSMILAAKQEQINEARRSNTPKTSIFVS